VSLIFELDCNSEWMLKSQNLRIVMCKALLPIPHSLWYVSYPEYLLEFDLVQLLTCISTKDAEDSEDR
jgi:hypothetical protein